MKRRKRAKQYKTSNFFEDISFINVNRTKVRRGHSPLQLSQTSHYRSFYQNKLISENYLGYLIYFSSFIVRLNIKLTSTVVDLNFHYSMFDLLNYLILSHSNNIFLKYIYSSFPHPYHKLIISLLNIN